MLLKFIYFLPFSNSHISSAINSILSYLMGASCGGDITDQKIIDDYAKVGLHAQHAYSVLDIQQVGEYRYKNL